MASNLAVVAELEIVRDALRKVQVMVPLHRVNQWSVKTRARIEQWAIHTRWRKLKHPPCPSSHAATLPAKSSIPAILAKYTSFVFHK